MIAGRSLAGEIAVLQRRAGNRWVSSKRLVLRRVGKRGSAVVSGAKLGPRAPRNAVCASSIPSAGRTSATPRRRASRSGARELRSIRGNVRALVVAVCRADDPGRARTCRRCPRRPRSEFRRRRNGRDPDLVAGVGPERWRFRPTERSSRAATPTLRRARLRLHATSRTANSTRPSDRGASSRVRSSATFKRWRFSRDGKILLVGNSSDSNTRRAVLQHRPLPTGRKSSTPRSDPNGLVRGPDGGANAVALQADGRIVVAGTEPENYAFKLVRLNVDGTLDSSFGSNGSVRALLGYAASASAVIVQPDGRILAAGASVPGNPPPPPPPPPAPPPPPPPGPPPLPWDLTLLRYNADGSLDPSFGSSGVVTTRLGPGSQVNAPAASVALQPDGNIVAASENDRRFALARYGTDGALDPTFGSNGIVKTPELQASGFPSGLALQTDGRIVIAGGDGIARYRSNGTPDAAFGINGVARANISHRRRRPSARRADRDRWVSAQPLCAKPLRRRVSDHDRRCAARRGLRKDSSRQRNARTQTVRSRRQGHPAWLLRLQHAGHRNHDDGRGWLVARSGQPKKSHRSVKAMVDGEASLPLVVQVRPKLMLKRFSRTQVRARGVAGRSLADQTVVLQRFARGRWVDGRRVTLRRSARRGFDRHLRGDVPRSCRAAAAAPAPPPQHFHLLRERSEPGDQGLAG